MFTIGNDICVRLMAGSSLGLIEWHSWDTWIVVTAAVAAMSCTLPGVWLVLRQQSMMGDALSHTALPGVVLAFLGTQWLRAAGWLTPTHAQSLEPVLLALGAIVIGILTAIFTEWVQKLGHVDGNAALGVVFTTFFALGLVLIRLVADDVHLDPNCVLFGQLELVVWDQVTIGSWSIPRAILTNGGLLLLNGVLMAVFFKELRLAAFDPELGTSLGIRATLVNSLLMGITAATVVMAFESVGSILVVAILIVPAACGILWCDRLPTIFLVSLLVALCSAGLGHVLARTVPAYLFSALGMNQVQDAGTPGVMAVVCGLCFLFCFLFSPHHGVLGRLLVRGNLILKMAGDDILSTLYRFEERQSAPGTSQELLRQETRWIRPLTRRWTLWRLQRRGLLSLTAPLHLTEHGRTQAAELVRAHRLWESYLQKHFQLPDDHLHESAHLVEHYLDQELRTQLEKELDSPDIDPHGREIPPA